MFALNSIIIRLPYSQTCHDEAGPASPVFIETNDVEFLLLCHLVLALYVQDISTSKLKNILDEVNYRNTCTSIPTHLDAIRTTQSYTFPLSTASLSALTHPFTISSNSASEISAPLLTFHGKPCAPHAATLRK